MDVIQEVNRKEVVVMSREITKHKKESGGMNSILLKACTKIIVETAQKFDCQQ